MNILHITLGIPSKRSGGLISYSYSLAKEEQKLGNSVSILYPGERRLVSKRSHIKKDGVIDGITTYRLVNPNFVPVPLGVSKPSLVMKSIDGRIFAEFLDIVKPDIVHIHTLMGFPIEFFLEIDRRNIFSVFSTHDYYGLCPRASFMYKGVTSCQGMQAQRCFECNYFCKNSSFSQFVLQSRWYPLLKNNRLLKALKKRKTTDSIQKTNEACPAPSEKDLEGYKTLQQYFADIFKRIKVIHCNSSVTNSFFKRLNAQCFTLNLTTDGIVDNRNVNKNFNEKKLIVGYIGIASAHKGFQLMINVAKNLSQYRDIEFKFYGDSFGIDKDLKNCVNCGTFSHDRISEIMNQIDVLVIPSIWYETFGFVGLEAIANCVPVLVSNRAGIKDVFPYSDNIFEPNVDCLSNRVIDIYNNREILIKLLNIQKQIHIPTMREHTIALLDGIQKLM